MNTIKENLFICNNCGHIGHPENEKLDFFEVLLWLIFLPIGIIYTIHRLVAKCNICPRCNKRATMIPTDTPLGQKLYNQLSENERKDVVFRRQRCAVCEKEYPAGELVKIDSGQLICPECHNMFEKKRQVKL